MMRLNGRLPFTLLLASGIAAPASAQAPMTQEVAACVSPAELPAPLASWRSPVPFKAGIDRKSAEKAALTPGQAVTLALSPTPKVAYPMRPAKPGGSVSFGGIASFTVAQAGTWRVALGTGAWVDVVKGGAAATSIAHGHGPDCSGVRKMVDYSLEPGVYTLQIAANGEDRLTVLVTPLP